MLDADLQRISRLTMSILGLRYWDRIVQARYT